MNCAIQLGEKSITLQIKPLSKGHTWYQMLHLPFLTSVFFLRCKVSESCQLEYSLCQKILIFLKENFPIFAKKTTFSAAWKNFVLGPNDEKNFFLTHLSKFQRAISGLQRFGYSRISNIEMLINTYIQNNAFQLSLQFQHDSFLSKYNFGSEGFCYNKLASKNYTLKKLIRLTDIKKDCCKDIVQCLNQKYLLICLSA